MYIAAVVETAPQLCECNDLIKAVVHAVEEFSTEGHRAWSGHPAAPTLVLASRNGSALADQKIGTHTKLVLIAHDEGGAGMQAT